MILSIPSRLQRWVDAGLIDKATAKKIADYENKRGGLNFTNGLFGIGGFAIFLGIAAIISVNWVHIPPYVKLGGHFIINFIVFKILLWCMRNDKKGIAIELLAGGFAGLTLTFIMLTGQIYQSQEPLWKALTLWLVLVTPFLFTLVNSRFLINAWVTCFIATYVLFLTTNPISDELGRTLCITLMPFILIAVGQNTMLRGWRENWGINISYVGFTLIALMASFAQITWRVDFFQVRELFQHRDALWQAAAITLLAAFILVGWRRTRLLVPMAKSVDVFLPLSVIIGFLPLLTGHENLPVIGAIIVMAYWAMCGWTGMVAGYPKALNLAITLIALRLFVVYIEVFGTLLETGIGLIISGAVLIALVYGTRRILSNLPKSRRKAA